MRYFQDTGLLILYSFPTLFFIDPDSHFIIALLCSLILICCCYVFESRIFLSILFLIYGLLTLLASPVLPGFYLRHFISASVAVSLMGCRNLFLPVYTLYIRSFQCTDTSGYLSVCRTFRNSAGCSSAKKYRKI